MLQKTIFLMSILYDLYFYEICGIIYNFFYTTIFVEIK